MGSYCPSACLGGDEIRETILIASTHSGLPFELKDFIMTKRILPALTIKLCALLSTLFLGGCSRVVVGPPIDLTRPVSVDVVRRLLREEQGPNLSLENYRLGPGDVISIQLLGQNEVLAANTSGGESEFLITDNPMLALPLIGAIRVHGKTSLQLQEDLTAAYAKMIINPQPLVIIKKFQSFQVAILGQINNAGPVPLEPGDTLMDIILRSGGLALGGLGSGRAPGRYIKVYREKVNRSERAEMTMDELIKKVNEGEKIIPREEIEVPIEDFLVNQGFSYNIPVKPNDIIYVPPAGSVNVIGRTGSPGIIFMGPSLRTLRQVLTQAGDMRYGAKSNVQIIRQSGEIQPEVYYLNGRRISKGISYDFVLQDGDQVIVETHPVRVVFEWFGNMLLRGTRAGVSASYNPLRGGLVP